MNNPYLLKKQLQNNEEELSNYLRDMNVWQEQMKRKEHSPSIKNPDEKKKPKVNHPPKTGLKKISSWDYSAWDKFDVDKACEQLDIQNEQNKNEDSSSEDDCSDSVLQSKQSEGLYEKNLGNALVQKQKWAEAILRYTRAIEYYDKDPVFYANRALCYLKINEFKLVISDCTSSLKLDSTYVKAYQRRSAAYMALGMFNEAKKDLIEVLRQEPNNKQAKIEIEVVNNTIIQDAKQKNSGLKLQIPNASSNILFKEEQTKYFNPNWPSRVGCKQINSGHLPPHLRSKKVFCKPNIIDIQVDQDGFDNMHLLQTTLKEVCGKNKNDTNIMIKKKEIIQTEKIHSLIIPPSPQTYVQLKQDWAYLQNDSKLLFQYLKQIPGKRLPSIVRNSMDVDLFVGILKVLKLEFIQNGHEITDYLLGISQLPRLQMLVMFCSESDVACIKELLNYVSEFVAEDVFYNLKAAFGV